MSEASWAEHITERARAYWTEARLAELSRDKTLLLAPIEAAPLLRALSILRADGSIPPDRMRKYLQINHMVAVLGPSIRELIETRGTIRLLDAACGKSYLSLLLAWVLRERYRHPVQVLGVDRNEALITEVQRITQLAGLSSLVRHQAGTLEQLDVRSAWQRAFGEAAPIDGLIALHACDTATDDAIALGVALQCTLIAVAPCCQAELARGWASLPPSTSDAFGAVRSAPHLRRELGASITDAMRTLLLRSVGYQVWPIEFVGSEHTPKNTLLRAMRREGGDPTQGPAEAEAGYAALVQATGGVELSLRARLAALAGELRHA